MWIHCGAYTPYTNNACSIALPLQGPTIERLLNVTALSELMACMVEAWEPDEGRADSSHVLEIAPKKDENKYDATVGWLTYLSHCRGTVPPLPAPVRIERLGDKGTLITLTPERFTCSNPEHVALLVRVRELLGRAGVLKPLQPAEAGLD